MSADTTTFQLSALIRTVLDESDAPDVDTLTSEVLMRIRKPDQRAALEQCLPYMIRTMTRPVQSSWAPPREDRPATGGGAPAERAASATPPKSTAIGKAGVPPKQFDGSWGKAAMYRDWFERIKNVRMLGDGGNEKFFRDFDAADLNFAASLRETHAQQTLARAAQLRHAREVLLKYGADTIKDLPDAVAREELNGLQGLDEES